MTKYFIISVLLLGFATAYFYHSNQKEYSLAFQPIVKKPVALQAAPFTVLIVPGHDTDSGGANFRGVYERDLAVSIGDKIAALLNDGQNYKVIMTRDTTVWNPIFADYFKNNEQSILDFKNEKQAEDKKLMSSGRKKYVPDLAAHSEVDKKNSVILYGINKWANENDISLVLHIHFNDSERSDSNLAGTFGGFSIYIPEKQLANSSTSRLIAESIYGELKKVLVPEVVGGQASSLIEDQSLIAVGASGTLEKPAMLIEYGYIYEKPFRTAENREVITTEIAEQTVLGIKKYVNIVK